MHTYRLRKGIIDTSAATPLGAENKGFKMLQAMGWAGDNGGGLGAQKQVI
jgi:hypothetical protein